MNKINQIRNNLTQIINLLDDYAIKESNVSDSKILNKNQKTKYLELWQFFAENIMALELIVDKTSGNVLLNTQDKKEEFELHLFSFLTAYRFALQFIDIIQKDKRVVKLFEQKNESIGLGKSAYKYFKFHFLNIKMASRLSALLLINKTSENSLNLESLINEDKSIIYQFAKKDGIKLTLKNAKDILKTGSFKAWFPVQKAVANTIGNIKVWRNGHSLITLEQVDQLQTQLEPGDILLQRREWQATNIGIPGFWSHAALFLGTKEVLDVFFNDKEVIQWVNDKGVSSGKFIDLLETRFPDKFEQSQLLDNEFQRTVVEALAPGVIFTSLQQSLSCDSVAVLRPNLSKLEKAKAIFNAYYYVGLPYDYNFNFLKEDSIVCSELIYKSYQKSDNQKGIEFPLNDIAGKKIMPANEIAKMYYEESEGQFRQLELVVFLDGNEAKKEAVESNEKEFKESYKRPKWHVIESYK